MSREDICFLSNTELSVEMPLEITGKCTGIATLMQKVTTLMMADQSDPTRNYGGSLGQLLSGTVPRDVATLSNYFQQAADEVYSTLKEELSLDLHPDMPDTEKIASLKVDTVSIDSADKVSTKFVITNLAGDSNYFNIGIPINTGA